MSVTNDIVQHDGEAEWLTSVVSNLLDDDLKSVYADWLEERGDPRSEFLRAYVAASKSMMPAEFPREADVDSEWAELVGYRIVREAASLGLPEAREPAMKAAFPALRMVKTACSDEEIPVGASKLFGRPDLPPGVAWPVGNDCKAIYNDDTAGIQELAGFCGQINLADVADTLAGRDLPPEGLISFFCFQDWENDNPDMIGARVLFFPSTDGLVRTDPPKEFVDGNNLMDALELGFRQTLLVPRTDDLRELLRQNWDFGGFLSDLNDDNVLGFPDGDGGDSCEGRHLIRLDNPGECSLHIGIPPEDLAAKNFDAIDLYWVDFD